MEIENCKTLNYPWRVVMSQLNWESSPCQGDRAGNCSCCWNPLLLIPALIQDLVLFPPDRVKGLTMHWVSIDWFILIFLSEAWELSASIIFDFPMKSQSLPADKQQLGVVLSPIMCLSNPCTNGLCFLQCISLLLSLLSLMSLVSLGDLCPFPNLSFPSLCAGSGWGFGMLEFEICFSCLSVPDFIYPQSSCVQTLSEFWFPVPSRLWGVWFIPKILRYLFSRRFQHQGSRTCKHKFRCSKFLFFFLPSPPKISPEVAFMDFAAVQLLSV